MAPPTTKGGGMLTPKTALAFGVGIGIGVVLVAPVMPDTVGDALAPLITGAGSVILLGVGALGILMAFLALFYQFYL